MHRFTDALSPVAGRDKRSDRSLGADLSELIVEAGFCQRLPVCDRLERFLTFQRPAAIHTSAEQITEHDIKTVDSITEDPSTIFRHHDVRRNTSQHGRLQSGVRCIALINSPTWLRRITSIEESTSDCRNPPRENSPALSKSRKGRAGITVIRVRRTVRFGELRGVVSDDQRLLSPCSHDGHRM